ncbi:hypothetical protein [Pseudoclavibacter sp. RFBA6]|uniref:hypothetical protein n=1 Tax=Pseudoclavibacter sp. RFBA6 TaxID=2080573 RepID=UPI000CE7E47B|nr:hypothetical protein [Pseudoclavibacter sp. RFBA6]PPG39484.1 hypothetical protein C5C17_11885 [Pseudoclavibacter sp. RFBA6]
MTLLETHGEHNERTAKLAAEQADGTLEVPGRFIPSPTTRRWLYAVAVAVVPLLVTLGAVTPDVAGHVLTIAGAVFGLAVPALAVANTPK